MLVTLHINAAQPHQREHSQWLYDGFKKHGIKLKTTTVVEEQADVHIVSGPHYAKAHWQRQKDVRVIWLDRALYHGEKSGEWASMDNVSLGWLRNDGGRHYHIGSKERKRPEIGERNKNGKSIFLADYGFKANVLNVDEIRHHPLDCEYSEPLEKALSRHEKAIGYNTSALVIAGLMGLKISCLSEQSIMHERNWLDLLPYADWHNSEISNGEAWENLREVL